MIFSRIYDEGLAQASYLLGCAERGEALVVDPMRETEPYLEAARQHGVRIVAVAETHIHADYLSGARELAHVSGATLWLSGEGGAGWQYAGLDGLSCRIVRDGERIRVGSMLARVLHTPGHTPEHIAFLVQDQAAPGTPAVLLSGDFVFVGDLGRPDLLEEAAGIAGAAADGARQMFRSLRERFLPLPDAVEVWPGHGAGSACGRQMKSIPSSTVGQERLFSWWSPYLRNGDEAGFVAALLAGQPEVPAYFAAMKRLNRDGMPWRGGAPAPALLSPAQLAEWLAEGAYLVDTRDKFSFAAGHLPGAINIPAARNFSTWAGWLLPYDRPLVLLAEPGLVRELADRLSRVGLDQVAGYIPGLEGYATPDQLQMVPQLSAAEARRLWESGEVLLLDVRARDEFRTAHIPGAINLHAGRVLSLLDRIPADRPIVVHCQGGDRSSITLSALRSAGITRAWNLRGGIEAWREQGFPLETGAPASG